MYRTNEDNTVFVLHEILRTYKIKISGVSIKNFLHAHPYFPTLKSVCDALKKWGIEHYPLKLEHDEVKALELPFIAHLNISGGQLAFVKKIKGDTIEYSVKYGEKQKEDFEEFVKKISGAVILIEPNQKVSDPNYRMEKQTGFIEKMLLPISIVAVFLISVLSLVFNLSSGFSNQLILIELLSVAVLGIATSVFLVLHEFKIHTSVGDKLCGFSSKTDCDTVLSSDASKLFGNINWADVGLIYFVGLFIYLLGSNGAESLSYIAILSVLALPYPIYSIYYQGFILKKWCPFCLVVQVLLVAVFAVLIQVFKNLSFSVFDFLRLLTGFFITATLWILYKTLNEKVKWGVQQHDSLLELKRNPEIFRSLITNSSYVEFDINSESLVLGNLDAPVTITAFLSLYCNPCAKAFKQLNKLIETCKEIRLNVVLSVYNDEETQKIINYISNRYTTSGSDDILTFLSSWYSLPSNLRKALYENEVAPFDEVKVNEINETNSKLFKESRIAGTPTIFVNGVKFPEQYNYSDIEYFVDDIKQLTLESKRQEACVNCNCH